MSTQCIDQKSDSMTVSEFMDVLPELYIPENYKRMYEGFIKYVSKQQGTPWKIGHVSDQLTVIFDWSNVRIRCRTTPADSGLYVNLPITLVFPDETINFISPCLWFRVEFTLYDFRTDDERRHKQTLYDSVVKRMLHLTRNTASLSTYLHHPADVYHALVKKQSTRELDEYLEHIRVVSKLYNMFEERITPPFLDLLKSLAIKVGQRSDRLSLQPMYDLLLAVHNIFPFLYVEPDGVVFGLHSFYWKDGRLVYEEGMHSPIYKRYMLAERLRT